MTTFSWKNVFFGLAIVLVITLLINVIITFNFNKSLKLKAEDLKEKSRPGNIELTVVKNSKCAQCFDISPILSTIKNSKANITKEKSVEFGTQEARELMGKYKIEKVPAIIITGEIAKVNIQGLIKKDNALLFTDIKPPYTNAATGRIEGLVALYSIVDEKCSNCSNLLSLTTQIKQGGVKISSEKSLTKDSLEGSELIKKYGIDFVPTMIVSSDLAQYATIASAWPQVGSKESDGSYVLRQVNPPYVNLTTNKLRGIVNIVYLTDKSCTECYNINLHKEILTSPQSFAMVFDKEETVDIGDVKGKELIAKYNITQVPTVIISDEAADYPSSAALRQFFSVEKDGSYVFRVASVLGSYKDLTTKNIVKPVQQNQEATA